MQFTFIDTAGKVLFLRDDAERAELTHEEMTFSADFPYISDKAITTGQRIWFRSPSTNVQQIYEVRQAKTLEPDAVQQITAEHICISELTDEHTDTKEFEKKPIKDVLKSVLSGTQWSVGTVEVNPTSDVNISRGSVWQAILEIRNNYNVYIEARATLSDTGSITRRIDVKSTDGVWNGLRLSIDKNLLDPSVIIDDTNVATALYGYGGTKIATEQGKQNVEINFANVTWSKTSAHPAKPKGQKYLEDPTATKNYGRNGRPRFAYYQNTEILDPNVLLQKTWEALQACSTPDVSVDGTVEDLKRMGYADQPIKLHDIALVEVSPAGFKKQIQIIRFREDLLDPSGSAVTIGAFVPNIVYFNKATNEEITGSPCGGGKSGGGGGGGNKSKQTERKEFETKITANDQMIQLRAYQNDLDDLDNDLKKQDAKLTVEHNRITAEVKDRRNADEELTGKLTVTAKSIEAEVKARTKADGELSSKLTITANEITQKVTDMDKHLSAEIKTNADNISLKVNKDGVISAINVSPESVDISASKINLTGYVTASDLAATNAEISSLRTGQASFSLVSTSGIRLAGYSLYLGSITVDGTSYNVVRYGSGG